MNKKKGIQFQKGMFACYNNKNWKDLLMTEKDIMYVSLDPAPTNYGISIEYQTRDGIRLLEVGRKGFNYKYSEDECSLYEEIIDYFNSYYEYYVYCPVLVVNVERQTNSRILNEKIAQHTLTYFCLLSRQIDVDVYVFDVDSKLRLEMLNAPKGMTSPETKKWSDATRETLLIERDDNEGNELMNKLGSRKHDCSDTILQREALIIYFNFLYANTN